ncbi:hypothetical protein GOARA_050_00660 [Gordonia araii NBRC 100433]|uniref:Pyrrolo-quinoline quinone n=1 Tax=Gordonia araii NBRC 100433 TaxID=1073574 RepID=G7H2C9_9ACTN|nr:hypothetical protein [Gordonia araii]NNG97543.1 hypothetical protein [Gordonia araii NBRC 100433]GAB10004.1 hypothetical protein GOARA_050_00660 [Gordonia araii NBRC 100433]
MRPLRRRPVDFVVSAIIVVALAITATATWYFSSARRTTLSPAVTTPTTPAYPVQAPDRLVTKWTARSAATRAPQVTDAVVLTGHDGVVQARDPGSGRSLWRYERELPLCGLLAAWWPTTPTALAAYRNARGCGEVTAIAADRGIRRATRSSDADGSVTLQSDGGYALSIGPQRLETWGSNLVRGIEYGRVAARFKPEVAPREGISCRLMSGMTAGDRVAIVEHCDGDTGYRLTVLGAVLNKDEKITQHGSSVITSGTAFAPPVVVAMSETGIAVYDGGANAPAPASAAIRTFDVDGADTGRHPVLGGEGLPASSAPVSDEGLTSVWTGQATVVLDAETMRPRFAVPGTRGPAVAVGGQMLVPTGAGYLVVDAATGRREREMPVPRNPGPADAAIVPAVIGEQIIEQHGAMITAYGP